MIDQTLIKTIWARGTRSSGQIRIMVAVLTIGLIGFLLDRVMLALQASFTHGNSR